MIPEVYATDKLWLIAAQVLNITTAMLYGWRKKRGKGHPRWWLVGATWGLCWWVMAEMLWHEEMEQAVGRVIAAVCTR